MNWADDDLYTSPPIEDDEPPAEMPPRRVIAGFLLTIAVGLAATVYLPRIGLVLGMAYLVGVVLAAAGVAALLHRGLR